MFVTSSMTTGHVTCSSSLKPLTYITEACQGRIHALGEGALAGKEAPDSICHQGDHHRGHLGKENGN